MKEGEKVKMRENPTQVEIMSDEVSATACAGALCIL